MTDGVQCVIGMEDGPIKDLQAFSSCWFQGLFYWSFSNSLLWCRKPTWYDQKNATATLAVWKPNDVGSRASGVGGFAIADISTLQDAIPFRRSSCVEDGWGTIHPEQNQGISVIHLFPANCSENNNFFLYLFFVLCFLANNFEGALTLLISRPNMVKLAQQTESRNG